MRTLIVIISAAGMLAACGTLGTERGAEPQAQARLQPASGSQVTGTVRFHAEGEGVRVVADVDGLTPDSLHGFHVHETGDCTAPDASSAGGHFNPGKQPHGHFAKPPHHAGDMPNLQANPQGHGSMDYRLEGLSLGEGPNSIIGRAVVVHAKRDDYRSQPAGDSGARIACGVIARG